MNKSWLVLTTVFLLFSACNAQNKGQKFDWKEFVSDEGKFKATFPVIPTKSVKETDLGSGKLQTIRFEVSLAKPEIYFGVLYADFPNAPIMNQDALKTNYDTVRDGFSKAANTKLISERDVWANGKLGRELVLNIEDGIVIYRTYLIEKRQFQLITSTNSSLMKDREIKKSIDKFLDSFQPTRNDL